MSDMLTKCTVCEGLIDEEDLFCANCGTEAPLGQGLTKPQARKATHNFTCDGCGASMSFDASARTLRCPFCASEGLTKQADAKVLAPELVVPFQVERQQAVSSMRSWLGRGFWRPGDLSEDALVVSMTPVYVPYWVFEAKTHTYWTADTNDLPLLSRGDWRPLSGEHRASYRDLLVGASHALTGRETAAICPFDMSAARPPDEVDLDQVTVEQFCVVRKYARPLARQGLEQLEAQACTQYVPGRCRNMHVNLRVEGLSSRPVLLPVWIMAYRYRDSLYRFLVNGQSGRATGQAPTSALKIAAAVGIAIVAGLIGLFLLTSLAG
jgi:hypothetical protein